jgi:hypothetical protein
MQRVVKKSTEYTTGKEGMAVFTKLSPNTARVDFQDETVSYPLEIIPSGETKNIPEYFQFTKLAVNGKINVKITLTEKNDGVAFISPATSEEKVKFLWFKGGDETAPVPTTRKREAKDKYDPKPACNVILEVTEGKWKGCRLWSYLQYAFGSDDEGVFIYSTKPGEKLVEFMDAVGVETSQLKPSENLLPEIQKLAQEQAREFTILIEKGWVNRFMSENNDEAAWVEEDETIGFTEAQKEEVTIHPALSE